MNIIPKIPIEMKEYKIEFYVEHYVIRTEYKTMECTALAIDYAKLKLEDGFDWATIYYGNNWDNCIQVDKYD